MLVVSRDAESGPRDTTVSALPSYLREGDCLVVNDTRVVPARFMARRATGGRIEGLYLRSPQPDRWIVLLKPSSRLRAGEALTLVGADAVLHLTRALDGGQWEVRVEPEQPASDLLERVGRTPLPPYIKRPSLDAEGRPGDDASHDARRLDAEDRQRYQTVYARHPGAVAAPTAGLHLTESLLEAVRTGGVQVVPVTLHVGLGTFEPIRVERLEDHRMHTEWADLPSASSGAVAATRSRGGRIVAVGTTAARVLESRVDSAGQPQAGHAMTDLFIYPPYRFRVVDVLLTNFHLPRSTLLAMVCAFAGRDRILDAYRHAVELEYRFYSYGDAMLIV